MSYVKGFKGLAMWLVVLVVVGACGGRARADEKDDLSREYINLLYDWDDLSNELDVLDAQVESHKEYLFDLDISLAALSVVYAWEGLTEAEAESVEAQMDSLGEEVDYLQWGIENLEEEVEGKEQEINDINHRLAEIEYELTGL